MRAEMDASLCIPRECPVNLHVDETKAVLATPGVGVKAAVSPFEFALPTVEVTIPDVTVTLPTTTVTVAAEVHFDAVFEYIEQWRNLVNGLDLTRPGDLLVSGMALGMLAVGTIENLIAPRPEVTATVEMGSVKFDVEGALTVALGSFQLFGMRVDEDHQPLGAELEIDGTEVSLALSPLNVTLQGCVVLDGADGCRCGHHKPPPGHHPPHYDPCPPPQSKNPPIIERADGKEVDDPSGDDKLSAFQLIVSGRGFGEPQGRGAVSIRAASGSSSQASTYDEWTDTEIRARFIPPPPSGPYAVVVINDAGLESQAGAIFVP